MKRTVWPQSQFSYKATLPRRRRLSGAWTALIWPQFLPKIATELLVHFTFDTTNEQIRGHMHFKSPDKRRGTIRNILTGAFISETRLELRYEKKDRGVIGHGFLCLAFSTDARKLAGTIVGFSSHTGEPFQSTILAVKGEKADMQRYSLLRRRPTIFIGHGRETSWKKVATFLRSRGYRVETFESGARAGKAITEVLATMMAHASFAILIMTGEDKMSDGRSRARQNVIHELGLFQATLGMQRAIILLEDGTEEFTNVAGTTQIRFPKSKVHKAFSAVIATIKREFPNK